MALELLDCWLRLRLIELGIKPVIFERGKKIRERRRDIANLNKHILNNDSNYCFGEGGAGTFFDGKLYTRSKKRGDINRIFRNSSLPWKI